MKKILLIATGGTIASSESSEGLTPSIDVKTLLTYIPEIESICHLEGISVMRVDSTNMNPKLMARIAETIAQNYDAYDGFVIAHGTDTMAYSAAGITYMLKNLAKPVVFTGSQIPIEALYTDAKKNLSDAIRFACEGIRGVYVAFDGIVIANLVHDIRQKLEGGKINKIAQPEKDELMFTVKNDGIVINGTHAMKIKTRSSDAFKSINFPVIAEIKLGKITYNQLLTYSGHLDKLSEEITGDFAIDTKVCRDIFVLKIFPGIGTELFDFIRTQYKGVIIESFGIGGIPNVDEDIASKIHELIEAGVAVVITTQCIYEGIDLSIYEVGQTLGRQKVIVAADMTTEAVVMKLMWALAHYEQIDDIKRYMETPYFADRSY